MMDIASWRWVFWVALPLTAAVIAVTLTATRGYKSVISKGTYDWVGLLLGATGITLLTYGLQNSSASWTATGTWGTIVAGIALLGVFGVVESRIAHPLVDFSLWKERLFSGVLRRECGRIRLHPVPGLHRLAVLHQRPGLQPR